MTARASAAEGTTFSKPYKGPDSYQPEDADLFFGRDRAAEQVIARILSSRFSVLHAPSGAGKTSLLNARVIPGLECRGWLPLRVLPQDDPSEAVRVTAFRDLLTSPRDEALAIERTCSVFAPDGVPLTLGDAISRYDALSLRDPMRRALVGPIESSDASVPGLAFGTSRITPFFCRLLRGSMDAHRYAEHLTAICNESIGLWQPEESADLRALATLLRDPARERGYTSLVHALQVPVPGLRPFFENWWDVLGDRFSNYSLVLIFDQFEELFTRFADPGPRSEHHAGPSKPVLHWRIRDDFVRELGELFAAASVPRVEDTALGSAPTNGEPGLPLRFVVALRDEYIAQLDPIRRVVWDLDSSAFHLDMLLKSEAATAITEPAKEYGYRYADDCFSDIVAKLAREDRFVEPAHLQIVCERLWNERGKALAQQSTDRGADGTVPEIDFPTYKRLGGAEGILKNYIDGFLDRLSAGDRLEALDILEPLITVGGTRNIVEWTQLIEPPMRDAKQRERLLLLMQKQTIVRVEWRLGGLFVEITHEFLIDPILRAIRQEIYGAGENARFIQARRALDSATRADFRSEPQLLLTARDLEVLHEQQERIKWTPVGLEIMLRSAITHSSDADHGMLRTWARRYAAGIGFDGAAGSEAAQAGSTEEGAPKASEPWTLEHEAPPRPVGLADLVGDYTRSSSPTIRSNAVRALAAIEDEGCVQSLVGLATSASSDLREIAQEHVLALEGQSVEWAKSALLEALHIPTSANIAYSLLGRWHAGGHDIPPLEVGLVARIRLAMRAGPKASFRQYRHLGWPQLGPALAWAVLGVVFTVLVFTITLWDEPRYDRDSALGALGGSLALLTPVFVLVATRRSGGVQYYPDQIVGAAVEWWRAARSVLYPFPLAPALAFSMLVLASYPGPGTGWVLVALSLCIAALVAAIRAGTLLAYEAFSVHAERNRLLQSLTGTATGLLAGGCLTLAMSMLFPNRALAATMSSAVVLMVPVTFGLARAYSTVDAAAPPRRPILVHWSRPLSLAALGTFVWLIAAAVWALVASGQRDPLEDPRGLPASWQIADLPARIRFVLPARRDTTEPPTAVVRGMASGPGDGRALTLTLTNSKGDEIDRSTYPPEFELDLAPDTFGLKVGLADESQLGSLSLRLLQRLLPDQPFSRLSNGGPLRVQVATKSEFTDPRENARMAERLANLSEELPLDSAARQLSVAVGLIEAAIAADSVNGATANQLNAVCWEAAIAGLADHVLGICEQAVVMAPDSTYIIDSRGLALALTGNRSGAIRDFQAFMKDADSTDRLRREDWIRRLQSDGLTLEAIRQSLGRPLGRP